MPIAYAYIRWSTDDQEDGDSLRRQESLRDAWLKRHPDVKLAETYTDRGVSGYSGKHIESGELGKLLALVRRGRVPHGSYLLVENLDRLSRLGALSTVNLVAELTRHGVNVVTLQPEREYGDADDYTLLTAMLEGIRGHSESKRKSERIAEAWSNKKRVARETGRAKGGRVPFWLVRDGDCYKLRPKEAGVVRRIFQLAATRGVLAIAKEVGMAPTSVRSAIRSRAAIGTWQPMRADKPDGDPVEGHFPAVVSEAAWYAAQKSLESRHRRCGRPMKAKQPALFTGLLRCARDRCTMRVITKNGKKFVVSSLARSCQGGHWLCFPLDILQRELLKHMRELDASELFSDPGAGPIAEVQARLAKAEEALAVATEEWKADPSNAHWRGLVSSSSKQVEALQVELADAKRAAASPASASWADIAETDPETLRSALLLTVERIECVVVKRGRTRALCAQAHFKGSPETRTYVISGDGTSMSGDAQNAHDFAEPDVAAAVVMFLELLLQQ